MYKVFKPNWIDFIEKRQNIHIHPVYEYGFRNLHNSDNQSWKAFDIALIKLTKPHELTSDFKINTICLPDNTDNISVISDNQYVVTAGWGKEGLHGMLVDKFVQIGPKVTVRNPLVDRTADPTLKELYRRNTFALKSIGDETRLCQVLK